jgi:DNA ligase 1
MYIRGISDNGVVRQWQQAASGTCARSSLRSLAPPPSQLSLRSSMDGTLRKFAEVNDAAAATTSKLKKQAIFAEYVRTLSDDDLRRAIRYAAGRDFPATDERVIAVGWAILSDVLLPILGIDLATYHDLVVKSGEIGEALRKAWPDRTVETRLALRDIATTFDTLAKTGNQDLKRSLVHDLFHRCATKEEAAYLAKIISGEMRTGVQEGTLTAAIAEAFGKDGKAVQRCQLLVGDLEEVAVLAKHDRMHEARFALFHPIQFMLATAQDTPEIAVKTMAGRPFCAEDKLDGIRAQVHKQGDRIAIYTRTMDRTDESFPDVVEGINRIPGDFLLDGEIVPWCDGCVLPFAHLQRRLGRKTLSPELLEENPTAFIAFDCLYLDGRLLMDEPLRVRRAALESLAPKGLMTTTLTQVVTAEEIQNVFAAARGRRNEGIILKDPDSPYAAGRRGQAWLKLKEHLPTLDCVITAAEYGNGKRRNSLSDYTFAVWDGDPASPDARLVNIGKAYMGVTDAEIAQLTETLLKLSVGQHGRVHLVEPKVVLEIACDQIQRSARHASGFAMRFPRVKRIRTDKLAADADRIERVREIYAASANTAFNPNAKPKAPKRKSRKPIKPPEPTLFDSL